VFAAPAIRNFTRLLGVNVDRTPYRRGDEIMKKRLFFIAALLAVVVVIIAVPLLSVGALMSRRGGIVPPVNRQAYDYDGGFGGGAGGESMPLATSMPMPSSGLVTDEETRFDAFDAVTANAVPRLVIKNANLSLVVKDPVTAVSSITTLTQGLEGFVVSSSVYQASVDAVGNKIMRASITIRVPAEKLNEALAQIKALAVTVETENLTGEDVTAQYTDMESHLKNLQAAETQLQKIMDSAVKTDDVLNVYNQLVSIRDQIEQVKGQMKYYSESAAMSAIVIDLIPDALSQPIEVGGWKPEGVAKEAIEALLHTLQGIANVLIWIAVYILPLALVLGIPGYIIIRLIMRRLRKKTVTTA
jgi:hypothetical protein